MKTAVEQPQRHTVEAHMGLVHREAWRFRWACGASLGQGDLVQAGALGLMTACERFDEARGTAFATCAVPWIRHYIGREIANHGRTVRVPVYMHARARQVRESLPPIFSLDVCVFDGDAHGSSYLDALPAPAVDLDQLLDDSAKRETVATAIAQLPARTRELIAARFWGEQSLSAIGKRMGITRERAGQIQAEGLERLRELLADERIER